MQTDLFSLDSIVILLAIIMILWVVVLIGSLTRLQRFGRLSTALTILAIFVVIVSAINLGIELVVSFFQASGHPNLTTVFLSMLALFLGTPCIYILNTYGIDKLKDDTISLYFDRSANDAFTVGITLQVAILTLFIGGALYPVEEIVGFFILVVIIQLLVYILSFSYHIRQRGNQSLQNSHSTD